MASTAVRSRDETRAQRRPSGRVPFAAVVLGSLALAAATAALPDSLPWWPIKFTVATYAVMLLPGATILRIVGWPRSPAAALAGATAWSMTALAPGLAAVFLLDTRLDAAIVWLVLVVVVALVAGRGRAVDMDTRIDASVVLFALLVVGFAVVVALAPHGNTGDAIEHMARLRKLTELNPLRTLADVNLLPPDTGLHAAYAFPLWHAVVGVIVRISGIDEAAAFRSIPPLLVPLIAAAVYRAGRSMFGCRAAGVATWIACLALFAFPYHGHGYFVLMSYPGHLAIFLFWPLVVDRVFLYLRRGGLEPVLTVAAASFVVAAIHSSYSPFMMLLVAAFAVARFIMVRDLAELRRFGMLFGALTLPFLMFLVWLYPVIKSTTASPLAQDYLNSYKTHLAVSDNGMLRLKPGWLSRGGAAHIAALALAPLAVAAARTRAAAFIASGTVVVVLVLTVPWLFTPFSDLMSVSQGRRFLAYLPWMFALTGGVLVLARFRYFAVAGALAAGWILQSLYPGDFNYRLIAPGPEWVAWFAALGALAAFAAGVAGKLHVRYRRTWALATMVAFALPIGIQGVPDATWGQRDRTTLPAPMLTAVRQHVDRDDVVLAWDELSYHLTARAPVYTVAVTRGHSADTLINRHHERREDVARFFSGDISTAQAEAVLTRWDVDWLLIDKARPYPEQVVAEVTPVFNSRSYALYPVEAAVSGS